MRSLFGLLAGVTLLLLVSCTADLQETIIPHEGDVIELTAYADNGIATKTGIVDNGNGGKNVVWKSGNAISLFFNSGDNGGNKFTTTDSSPVATFKGSISAISGSLEETGGKAYFWGLYPYNASASCDGTNITTTLPSSQLAYQGDVADDLLVTVGRSENLAMSFKNACAVIGFTLSQDNISKVTFSGRNNEYVAGEFKASFNSSNQLTVAPTSNGVKSIKIIPAEAATFTKGKTYYFAILPGTFSSGYSLTFTKADGTTATYKRTSSFTFAISTFYTMTNKDSGLTFTSGQGTNPTENITFADSKVKTALVNKFDNDGDGDLSKAEAAAVTSLEGVFGAIKTYKSFDEFQYFTNVSDIPESMFAGWRLTSIKLPESIRTIGANAFNGCTALSSIVIPDGVTILNGGTFSGCSALESVSLPSNLREIGDAVYNNDKRVYEGAFEGCTMATINIPSGLTKIGSRAFSGCTLLSPNSLPAGLTTIGDYAFSGCSALDCELPSGVTTLGAYAFSDCISLSSISISNNVTQINSGAFSGCTSLESVDLPDYLSELGEAAFSGCSKLKNITIPVGINVLNCVFMNCTSLESIVIPESVTTLIGGGTKAGILYGCFAGCSSLSSVVIPESVTKIGYNAFYGCSSLSSVIIPESVTDITCAFDHCTGLTSIVIPESVTSIEDGSIGGGKAWGCFCNCNRLTTVVIPNSIPRIGSYAFYCSNLSSVTIPESVTSIGERAFDYCNHLTSITVLNETPPQLEYQAIPSNATIYVPKNSVDAYKSDWSDFESKIQAIPD